MPNQVRGDDLPPNDRTCRPGSLRYGYGEIYEGCLYTMLNIDHMKCWTMGAPVRETNLINRKYLPPLAEPPATATSRAV